MDTDVDLSGLVDLHLHSSPDTRPRLYDDIGLARAAKAAGLRAIMIKSHVTMTPDRAAIAEKVVGGIRVLGAIALNRAVGGLNPAAVDAAIALGARQVWMPTSSAAQHVAFCRRALPDHAAEGDDGITILRDGKLTSEAHEILSLVARADIILGTGHLSALEIAALAQAARQAGVRRILITHPELAISGLPLPALEALARLDVWFEHCFISTIFVQPTPMEAIAASIRAVGPERIILSSDLGLAGAPGLVEGWRAYLTGLHALGVSWRELERMTRRNPAELAGL